MVGKVERKAGAFILVLDDKYSPHRKHTESTGNFEAAITSKRYTKVVTVT